MNDNNQYFQEELFTSSPEIIQLHGGELVFYRNFFEIAQANTLFDELLQKTAWETSYLQIAGKTIPIPRQNAWYGDPNKSYTYSNIKLLAKPWFSTLNVIRQKISSTLSLQFNSCLLNLYRNENDSVAWHCDDEPELGRNPLIVSVSLGATRKFTLRSLNNHQEKLTLNLTHGSLLIMQGEIQHRYEHQIPKEKVKKTSRINLTFRNIID